MFTCFTAILHSCHYVLKNIYILIYMYIYIYLFVLQTNAHMCLVEKLRNEASFVGKFPHRIKTHIHSRMSGGVYVLQLLSWRSAKNHSNIQQQYTTAKERFGDLRFLTDPTIMFIVSRVPGKGLEGFFFQ